MIPQHQIDYEMLLWHCIIVIKDDQSISYNSKHQGILSRVLAISPSLSLCTQAANYHTNSANVAATMKEKEGPQKHRSTCTFCPCINKSVQGPSMLFATSLIKLQALNLANSTH